ncbi:DUF952 domain-containing protein [Flavimaricola marinus]|uniref:DUF952 domain-containing protein n=1 Tax=Flavimaricola marinus TaxID=1819565 RepID=A0A238LJN9_9RHOB|nr:DUF952 domain-containing protein [Flavimaricola marinus]SMY09927.1 hypothetical protein LOM8899_04100 [Flavimaricola marinus]
MMIYKLFLPAEWAELQANGQTAGAPIDIADGYVHFSTAKQVAETAEKYFSGVEGLVLLGLDAAPLEADLKWEPSRGGALFPHLYRELRLSDVTWDKVLPWDGTRHIFPELA